MLLTYAPRVIEYILGFGIQSVCQYIWLNMTFFFIFLQN